CTVVPLTRFVPFTVKVYSAPAAVAEFGLWLARRSADLLIVNVAGPDVPPAVVTVTLAVPALAIRLAGTVAVTCTPLTYVVVSAVAPHCTVAPLTKFVPFTVKVNPAPPAVAEFGLRLVMVGVGGLVGNVAGADERATGFTVTLAVHAPGLSLVDTVSVSCRLLTYG